ncbi:uncharacterized protein PV09_07418 [Verruconis gallopava]|uniref:Heterokaryon incompatibility domain-containing protein n=1 Tax=Verruconis gallopava TaxID=253628 RepID=A0A0D1YJU3_9PEZI|nr:uncharacterized protein PV09_07418 [Verruconis gallopava]KIW01132.1 hypothetical protein PV09_07418 [Verruconis gallopava]
MEDSTNDSVFEHIWAGVDIKKLTCCECKRSIDPQAVLARTFTLESQLKFQLKKQPWSDRIVVSSLSDAIIVYHRHLNCLLRFEKYAAVSHVWHSGVASLQYSRNTVGPKAKELARVVLERPVQIYRGIQNGNLEVVGDDFELWHDYISIPQWQQDIKMNVIQSIADIYSNAAFVLIDFHDVEASAVQAMRFGKTVRERACGISDICNAKYWSRMWTAMEFSKSKRLVPMLKDFVLLQPNPQHETVMHELDATWAELGDGKMLEVMIGIGNNLCPWQVGGLTLARDLNLCGEATAFANAYDFLSRRGVTNSRDFFYAFLAILKSPIAEHELPDDDHQALLQIARDCIRRGDYSPLLMAPQDVYPRPNEAAIRSWGYVDLRYFSLGEQQIPATYKDVDFQNLNPIIKAEHVGAVTGISGAAWGWEDNMGYLAHIFEWTYRCHGQDIEKFVHTVGERMFGQPFDQIMQRLSQDSRLHILEDYLRDLSGKNKEPSVNWKQRARELGDALGLSNSSLKSTVGNPRSPIDWMLGHGYTIHLGEALTMRIVDITCPACHVTFLLRVALYSRDTATITGAHAFRVPGLKFANTLAGGVGLLIKDGRSVGRFLWGTPTCECEKLRKVEIKLDSLPLPEQNTLDYGVDKTRTSYYLVGRGERVDLC